MTATLDTPLGAVSLRETAGRIVGLDWHRARGRSSDLQDEGLRQLSEYFSGQRRVFDLPLDWGLGLNAAVRKAMSAIPFGETRTYGDIAKEVGAPAQAVGQACGANPIPILIPCHRVVGARSLGGYSGPGGVETKVALLRLEGAAGLLL